MNAMSESGLGSFEEIVLLAVCVLPDEAYGARILSEIAEQTGKEVSLGAVHATLYRLQEKGFLDSNLGGATDVRGGRRKRLFRVTGAGMEILQATRDMRERMWSLMPQFEGSAS
jgi:DNA-binding PadR family transcriptional regulator